MKIQHIKAIAVVALIAFVAIAPIAKADDLTVGGSNTTGADSSLATGGSNTTGADSNTSTSGSGLTTGGSNTTGANPGISTGGSNTTGADSNTSTSGSGLTTGGSNTTGADATAPSNNNGGSTTGGSSTSSSGSSSSFGGSVLVSGSLPTLNNVGQCDYITDYLKIGWNNSGTEVNKLQAFLKDVEKLDVDVTGTFDQKTFDAVKAFQAKYVNDVMQPWGVTTPTGEVYYTTKKKINEIYCRTTFTLTPAQLASIEAYRTSLQNGGAQAGELNLGNESITGTSTATTSQEVGQATSTSQTAAAANSTSFWGKLWNFIKHIFGR